MERTDTIGPYRYYYDDALFMPGTDSLLLGAFAPVKRGWRICDLGAGTGLLGLALLAREPSLAVTDVELLPQALALAKRAAEENGLAVECLQTDLRTFRGGPFDLVVSNPPYFAAGSGASAQGESRQTAREEHTCTIFDVCACAGRLLRWGGEAAFVYRSERLADLFEAMRRGGIEPKQLQLVCTRPNAAPSLLLCEGKRGAKPGLTLLPMHVLHHNES